MSESDQVNSLDNDSNKEKQAPDENSGIYVRGFLKIIDPDTGKIIVETAN